MVHSIKCLPEYFEALRKGIKNFEVRKKDRPYAVGDYLAINEFYPLEFQDSICDFFRRVDDGWYSGYFVLFRITYILDNPLYCPEGMIILSLKKEQFCAKDEPCSVAF